MTGTKRGCVKITGTSFQMRQVNWDCGKVRLLFAVVADAGGGPPEVAAAKYVFYGMPHPHGLRGAPCGVAQTAAWAG
jgi:hypothetical protein